jgi:exosortase
MPVVGSPPELKTAVAKPTPAEDGAQTDSALQALGRQLAALPLRVRVSVAAVALMIVGLYAPTVIRLAAIWNEDPDYSHGYLVIPASLLFALISFQRLDARAWSVATSASAMVLGAVEIVLGVALHAIGFIFDISMLDVLSLVCVLRGSVLLVAGPQVNAAFAFPAMFLLFLAPLPPIVHQSLAIFMQQLVAAVSTFTLDLFGVPIYRSGYVVHLPHDYVMTVGEACSGLRSMIAIVALAVAMGFVTNGPTWYRWTLGLLALPVAGLTNCLRVVLTGVILMNLGKGWADGFMHTMEGMVMIVVAAAIMLAISYGLLRMDARTPSTRAA